jgi:hypothetical protein
MARAPLEPKSSGSSAAVVDTYRAGLPRRLFERALDKGTHRHQYRGTHPTVRVRCRGNVMRLTPNLGATLFAFLSDSLLVR